MGWVNGGLQPPKGDSQPWGEVHRWYVGFPIGDHPDTARATDGYPRTMRDDLLFKITVISLGMLTVVAVAVAAFLR